MVKELVQKFADGTADPNLFTTEAKSLLFPDRIKSFGEYLKPLGTPNDIQLVERKDEDDNRLYRYRLVYKDSALFFTLTLSKEGKIALVGAQPE